MLTRAPFNVSGWFARIWKASKGLACGNPLPTAMGGLNNPCGDDWQYIEVHSAIGTNRPKIIPSVVPHVCENSISNLSG